MKLKLLCSIICGIFMGFSSLLYAQATEIATEERDLSSNGASVTDVYFRHIDNQAWLDTEHNKTVKSPIERVKVFEPYEEKVAIVGKFNFVPLDQLLKKGDFVRVPVPSNVTLITRNYEIKDSSDNVIGHIVADKTKNYITFVFNPKIEYRTNVEGNFSIGAVLKAPVGDTTITLDKGPLKEYSYINDPKTTIYRGGNSVTITNINQPSDVEDKKDDAPCQNFWKVRGEGTSIDEHLTWTMYFNMNKYFSSATVYYDDIINKDYGTKKVIFKLFGNEIATGYKNRQSFFPFIRNSFELYETNVADGSIIGNKLQLFTDATEFANYTGTEQAGLITFNKSDYEVTIELKHGVGTKAYKVVYKTDNPADATYVGSKVMVNVDGQDINYKSEGCEDNINYYFSVIPTSLPLGVDANTDWANRLFLTKYKEEENGAILPAERVSFTLNKFVAGSDTEIDTAFRTITLTTDAKGKAKSEKLSEGKYILKETILPKGGGYMPYVETFEVIKDNEEPILKAIVNTKKRISYSFSGTGFRKYFPNLPAGSQYPEVSLNVKVTYAKDKNNNNITNPTVINIPVTIPAGTLEEGKNYVDFEPLKNIILYDEYGNKLEDIGQLIFEITEPTPPVGYAPEYNYGNNSMWIANYKEEVNTIQIYKYLDGNSSEAGEGAKFTIEKLDASGVVDTSFTKVTLTTGANGFAISETLTAGDYLLKEIRPANQIYTKFKPNPDPKATAEVEYKYEIEGGIYKISNEYRKGVKVTIVDGKTNLIKVNNESVSSYSYWPLTGKKIWKGAKSVATKPEVRLRVKLTYKPNKNDADGNPYPESVRILKPIIAAGTPITDKDGNEEVKFEYHIPTIDFYGNKYTSLPEVVIEEENIPGYKSEVDDSTYEIDKIIKVINTLAPPVVRVNPNLRMRISEDH